MSAVDLVESFDLNRLPDTFYDNPFPYYRALRESDGDRLSETELLHNCIFILNAGHETTTNLIGNALVSLCEWPHERRRLIKEPALINTAIEEFLRFESAKMFFAQPRFIRREGIVLALPR